MSPKEEVIASRQPDVYGRDHVIHRHSNLVTSTLQTEKHRALMTCAEETAAERHNYSSHMWDSSPMMAIVTLSAEGMTELPLSVSNQTTSVGSGPSTGLSSKISGPRSLLIFAGSSRTPGCVGESAAMRSLMTASVCCLVHWIRAYMLTAE